MCAVEQAVEQRNQRGVRGRMVHGRGDNQAVGLLELLGELVDDVVEHAVAKLAALSAGDAAADVLRANLDSFGFHVLFCEYRLELLHGKGGVPVDARLPLMMSTFTNLLSPGAIIDVRLACEAAAHSKNQSGCCRGAGSTVASPTMHDAR